MTLRSNFTKSKELAIGDLKEGQKVDGKVKKVEEYGIFIQIEGSKLSGLCHKTEVPSCKRFIVNLLIYDRSPTIKMQIST